MHNPDDLTFGFDPIYYKGKYPDLSHMTDEEALQHFLTYGHNERRYQSAVAARETLLPLIPTGVAVLEIGPFGAPQLAGEHVRYADYLSSEELRERAPKHGYDPENCPIIHYVLRSMPLGLIDARFAAVFSSHCIEHQPDLILHLQEVGRLLEEGAAYFLVVPDKRYCFDHFIPESDVADVLTAHAENRKLHSLRSILSAHSLTTHNDPQRHWNGDHGRPGIFERGRQTLTAAVEHYQNSIERNEYVDVHAWQFTPKSFHDLCSQLFDLGLIPLYPETTGATMCGRLEFCAILRKGSRNTA
ncbi:class I SAM-dependent methyltransferase [Paraburkholderia graminis]|uniref:class I SAM-dependent methyltransferase n=1 Tax=Paraburkholderia graminis TaxID=60548 RepID=UPI0038BA0BD8